MPTGMALACIHACNRVCMYVCLCVHVCVCVCAGGQAPGTSEQERQYAWKKFQFEFDVFGTYTYMRTADMEHADMGTTGGAQ